MPLIRRLRELESQPNDLLEVDWDHPLLVDCHAVFDGRVLHQRGRRSLPATWNRVGAAGVFASFSSDYIAELDVNPLGLIWRQSFASFPGSYTTACSISWYADSSNNFAFGAQWWGSSPDLALVVRSNNANFGITYSESFPREATFRCELDGSWGSTARLYRDDVQVASTVTYGTYANDTRKFFGGSSCAWAFAFDNRRGSMSRAYKELQRNPWQVFRRIQTPALSSASGGTASGVALSASASLIPGSAGGQISATAGGVTLTATASLTAGSASGQVNATAGGATLTAAASIVAGSATGQVNASASGQTLTATASIVPGAATGSSTGTAAGATITAAASLLPGSAAGQISATAPGATLTASSSLLAGSASGASAGTATGATLTASASLIAGAATGQQSATAAGVTLTASSSLVAGAAAGQVNGTAAGALIVATVSVVAGSATAANDATASGALLTASASLVPGSASGVASATASGVTLTASLALVPGGAYGPLLSHTPGFSATRSRPSYTAQREPPTYTAAIDERGRVYRPRRRAA